jgi:hypothetical protein
MINELPVSHPLRNMPLGSIRAEFKDDGCCGGCWKPVRLLGIQTLTFNELADRLEIRTRDEKALDLVTSSV